ncbi:pro-FMRFamide-related neuropeptide FF [Falco biarmicus]|uniref:pro-FMRFamide-related neuropeptide FF n=1 Tax=Falco cherrug TaxID=345164 RepID=UPI0024797F20|nr:pro-FMRFamide-related neuropeptide FF [Falco cherrug]XP_056178132.1 pro-FMRFamide-related neuropeptide FF [Falco biarmicus]
MAGPRLLLLLLLAGTLRAARCCPSPGTGPVSPDRGFGLLGEAGAGFVEAGAAVTPPRSPPPQAAAAPPGPPPAAVLGALLRSLQRPGRSPGPLQPQRLGQGGAQARLSPRSWDPPAAPFWTMATPQRFGRRR